jgi:hypothetical protein
MRAISPFGNAIVVFVVGPEIPSLVWEVPGEVVGREGDLLEVEFFPDAIEMLSKLIRLMIPSLQPILNQRRIPIFNRFRLSN